MSLLNEIYDECDELAGRLTAIRVTFPDTDVRVKHSIFQLRKLLENPEIDTMQRVVDELYDLKSYLSEILELDPKTVGKQFRPCIELIERLLGPTTIH